MRYRLKRQFNYTERAKIPRSAVKLRVISTPATPPQVVVDDFGLGQFKTGHDTEEWNHAHVILEANRHTTSSFARLVVGTVAEVAARTTPQLSAALSEFDTSGNIVFTVKVVSRTESRLLAEAKNIRAPEDEAQKDELLKVQLHDLGQEAWRLSWEDGIGPLIYVNKQISSPDNFLTRDAFMQGVVIPSALRMILLRLARDKDARVEAWAKPWLRFVAEYGHGEAPWDNDESEAPDWLEVEQWLNQTLASYCDHFRFTDKINDELLQSAPED